MKNLCLPFYRQPSCGFRGWNLILTFCRCSLAFFVSMCILLGFLVAHSSPNSILGLPLIRRAIRSILDMVIPSILLASNVSNAPEGDEPDDDDGSEDYDSEDLKNEIKDDDGLSEKSDDSNQTKYIKKEILRQQSEFEELEADRKIATEKHSAAQDESDEE